MLEKRSGPMTSTTWPAASAPRIVFRSVMTTPLIWGVHASVASRMRKRHLLLHNGRRFGDLGCNVLPVQDKKFPRVVLDEGRKALDPVAIVAIQNAADGADLGFVNVPAYHAVEA